MAAEKREVRWSEPAESDLWSIIEFIDQDRPLTAQSTLLKIRKRAQSLRDAPQKGRRIPEFERLGLLEYREIVISVWRLFYRISGREIEVVALFDSRRNVEDLLFLRLTRRH
jgi:toxin ParE1/3/4